MGIFEHDFKYKKNGLLINATWLLIGVSISTGESIHIRLNDVIKSNMPFQNTATYQYGYMQAIGLI